MIASSQKTVWELPSCAAVPPQPAHEVDQPELFLQPGTSGLDLGDAFCSKLAGQDLKTSQLRQLRNLLSVLHAPARAGVNDALYQGALTTYPRA